MAALDRFGGPESWDLHCYYEDKIREEQESWATCMDCGHCYRCDIKGHEDIGLCRRYDEWVTGEDRLKDTQCEEFTL